MPNLWIVNLKIFSHTAIYSDCDIFLNFPYAPVREINFLKRPVLNQEGYDKVQKVWLDLYVTSGEWNHHNFTHMAYFALSDEDRKKNIDVLDYGGRAICSCYETIISESQNLHCRHAG
jgi:hypothetical protein